MSDMSAESMANVVAEENTLPMFQDGLGALDAKERKRYQNRVAQRTYRENVPIFIY
jgi:hypothetical protein